MRRTRRREKAHADDGGDEQQDGAGERSGGQEMSRGIEPGGMTASRSSARPAGDDDGDRGRRRPLGRRRRRRASAAGADRLEHAVQGDAFDGEQGEEQRDDDDRDHDGHADDLVERRALLATPRMASTASVIVSDLGRAAGRGVDRAASLGASTPSAVRTTSAWNDVVAQLLVGPVGGQHRRATSPGRPTASLPGVADVVATNPTPSRVSAAGRARISMPPRRRRLAGRRRRRPRRGPVARARRGRQLVAEQGGRREVARSVARDPGAELHDAEPAAPATPGTASTVARVSASMRLRRNVSSAVAEYTMTSPCWARTAAVELRIRPSSSPPRNISSTATSVRMHVAVTKRPGRRRSSRSASLIAPPPRSLPRPDRSPDTRAPRAASSRGRGRAARPTSGRRRRSRTAAPSAVAGRDRCVQGGAQRACRARRRPRPGRAATATSRVPGLRSPAATSASPPSGA